MLNKLEASQFLEDTVLVWETPQSVQSSEHFQGPGGPRQGLL